MKFKALYLLITLSLFLLIMSCKPLSKLEKLKTGGFEFLDKVITFNKK